ncbi:metal ABC transporter substrate-binding protein [Lapillicoccus sp.]|uniref:metal ABC transporter substrate-binding protein n=1 Tax=Lapillicoccus sp. TaxID=1909287 RepID=UPI00398390A4
MISVRHPLTLAAAVLAVAAIVGGCGPSGVSDNGSSGVSSPGGTVSVVTSFYPVQYAVQQVGGSHVSVTSLTKAGAEPHDVELSAQDVAGLTRASLVVYAKGFQPAVDTAVDQEARGRALDVAPVANLDLAAPAEPGVTAADGAKDPHFWLDPQRYSGVVSAIADRLAATDHDHAADYRANATALTTKLTQLDADLQTGTTACRIMDLVTSHAAFGYLASRYGFTQVPIAGLSPDVEPSAAKLAEVADFVKAHRITTIYAETLVEPAFAETVARNTGAKVATLDPIEGLTSASAGADYLEVMRSNLAVLKAGQGCS